MKTLVIMGAARKNGHTRQMVDLFLEHLDGEKEIVDAYRTEVQPCMDCRFCWKCGNTTPLLSPSIKS